MTDFGSHLKRVVELRRHYLREAKFYNRLAVSDLHAGRKEAYMESATYAAQVAKSLWHAIESMKQFKP